MDFARVARRTGDGTCAVRRIAFHLEEGASGVFLESDEIHEASQETIHVKFISSTVEMGERDEKKIMDNWLVHDEGEEPPHEWWRHLRVSESGRERALYNMYNIQCSFSASN